MIHKFKKDDYNIVLDINSGSIHLVDDLIFYLLEYYPNFEKNDFKNKYKESKIKKGIEEIKSLIDKEQLFTKQVKKNNFEIFNKPAIKAMCLHIAHDCNMKCKYCFASQGDYKKRKRDLMSLEVGKKSLEFLAEKSKNRKNLEVDFFGGEPLMNFEVVKKLVKYSKILEEKYNKNFRFTITTNGLLLDEDKIEFINKHMDNVVLSIDGRKEVNDRMRYDKNHKGTYDKILPKFKNLIENRDKLYYLRGTFTGYNTDFSKDVLHLANKGFKSLSIEPVVTDKENEYSLKEKDLKNIFKEYDILAEKYIERKLNNKKNEFEFFHFNIDLDDTPCYLKKIRGCGAGLEYVAITPNGDIYPCHQFVEKDEFKMGNISTGINDYSIGNKFNEANVLSKDDCKDCWARFFCSGGCHANAYNVNGDFKKPYQLGCEMEKKRIENSIYIKAKLAMEG
ncbi:MAG: thioether cross-link-forming SCIFF peptide maturase [Bacillota bacterium]